MPSTLLSNGLLLLLAVLLSSSSGADDPIAAPESVVVFGQSRFTVLSPSLIRLEHSSNIRGVRFDDRATSVVINRKTRVPAFNVTHPNSTAITITTTKLRLTYEELAFKPSNYNQATCGCNETTCAADYKPPAYHVGKNVWRVHNNTDVVGSHRSATHPDGLTNVSLSACFCACMLDADCEAIEYAPPGAYLAKSCWLVAGVQKLRLNVTGRVFAGLVAGGPSEGFNDDNLRIEMLDPAAPVKEWRPSQQSRQNLNGTYPNLDCYTVPASCVASNQNRMEPGLLSRDGWAGHPKIKGETVGLFTFYLGLKYNGFLALCDQFQCTMTSKCS